MNDEDWASAVQLEQAASELYTELGPHADGAARPSTTWAWRSPDRAITTPPSITTSGRGEPIDGTTDTARPPR